MSRQRAREELSFSRSVHREKWMVQVGTHCRLTWGAQLNRPRLSVSSVKWGHLSLTGGPHAKALEQCLALDEGSRNALRDCYGYKASFLRVAVLMLTPRLR